jgi:hypothetical protein
MPYAVFCLPKNKNRAVDPPCLDPLDYGVGNEPDPHRLLRRGRVALFATAEEAEEALRATLLDGSSPELAPWKKKFKFQILECREVGKNNPEPLAR